MASLSLLAPELLIKIFEDEDFSNGDIARLQQVCKLFRRLVLCSCKRIIFRIDSPDQSAWKLVHHTLFVDSTLAKNCTEVIVQWKRRNFEDKTTWTKRWVWTPEERKHIEKLCETHGFSDRARWAMLDGVNSEVLLALFLHFTPKLRSLNLGKVVKNVLHPDGAHFGFPKKSLTALQWQGTCSKKSACDKLSSYLTRLRPRYRTLWFTEYLGYEATDATLKLPLPELRHLSCDSYMFLYEIWPVFFFPQITSIEMYCSCDWYPHEDWILFHPEKCQVITPTAASPLERLKITCHPGSGLNCGEFRSFHGLLGAVARTTSRLQSVYVEVHREPDPRSARRGIHSAIYGGCQCSTYTKTEELGRLFLENNKKTLAPTAVLIDGAGFSSAGIFQPTAERRRREAQKEKLWLETRGGISMKSPISAMPTELLTKILRYLKRSDVFNLMLVCKGFYETCHQHMWSRLPARFPVTLEKYVQLVNCIDMEGSTGLAMMESLDISYEMRDWVEVAVRSGFMDRLLQQIETEGAPRLKVIRIYIDWRLDDTDTWDYRPVDDCGDRLMLKLKQISEEKSPAEISLEMKMGFGRLGRLKRPGGVQIDFTKLTKFTVNEQYRTPSDVDPKLSLEFMIEAFSQAHHLKEIRLKFWGGSSKLGDEIKELWGLFEKFQNTVLRLSRLELLSVTGTFFHPSYFLAPPENCKAVVYASPTSRAWWRQFAKCRFTNVERLELGSQDYMKFDDHFEVVKDKGGGNTVKFNKTGATKYLEDFTLDTVEVSGLKWFDTPQVPVLANRSGGQQAFPANLVGCILERNKQLSEACLKTLAQRMAKRVETNPEADKRGFELNHLPSDLLTAFTQKFTRFREEIRVRRQDRRAKRKPKPPSNNSDTDDDNYVFDESDGDTSYREPYTEEEIGRMRLLM
ncbi:hypothetical protein TWF281_007485 [Arthrobotrys megalospora]